jgi:hypothetical protein
VILVIKISAGMFSVGFLVVLNADLTERFCAGHALSLSCDNVIAPGHDYPHGPSEPMNGPAGPRLVTQASSTATVSGPYGAIMR